MEALLLNILNEYHAQEEALTVYKLKKEQKRAKKVQALKDRQDKAAILK